MKTARSAIFGLLLVIGILPLRSQQLPLDQLMQNNQMQALRAANDPAGSFPAVALPTLSSSSAMVSRPPVSPARRRIADRNFLLLNGLHLSLSFADFAMTQHCIAEHKCVEANPMMPSSRGGQIGVGIGVFSYTLAGSYWIKKHNSRLWWIAPGVGIAAHTAGLMTGIAHR
jgi:hypothetical protein